MLRFRDRLCLKHTWNEQLCSCTGQPNLATNSTIRQLLTSHFLPFCVDQIDSTSLPDPAFGRLPPFASSAMSIFAQLKKFDIYRDVPRDLTEQTVTGAVVSLFCAVLVCYLFFSEFLAFLTVETVSEMYVDPDSQ
jgi:hypothetical protein